MLFGGESLARRIERAECEGIEECTRSMAHAAGVEAFTLPLAGGLAAYSGADSPLTKVAGLGFGPDLTDEALEQVEREFASRGACVQVELSTLAGNGIAERLTARGYALAGFENVLARQLDPAERWRVRDGIDVQASGTDELDVWIEVLVDALAAPDTQGVASHESFPREELTRILRGTASAARRVRYLARRAGQPAGGASFRLADGIAQLCGAGTLPEHRRRGVQSALLEERLAHAARSGCDIAVVTTLPGSKSQENVQKQGFELVYARAILRKPA
jgi:ribosomal protein S18 acetylase RimI-like enzyme